MPQENADFDVVWLQPDTIRYFAKQSFSSQVHYLPNLEYGIISCEGQIESSWNIPPVITV